MAQQTSGTASMSIPFSAPATYTIKQLLARQPQIPSPVSGISAKVLPFCTNRPDHRSSAASNKYEFIQASRLRLIPNLPITEFREVIDSMDSVMFTQPMTLPRDTSSVLSEGYVTNYLDAEILVPAWQAVLQMLPDDRDYDLQMVKQVSLVEGMPDRTFTIVREGTCQSLVVVLFTSAGVVNGLLSVLENAARGVKMNPTDDWKSVTGQLRMYATRSNVRDVLVMGESVAIYFCFPPEPSLSSHLHDYLFTSTKLGADFGDNPRLSVRELVVFALFSAFEKKRIELRNDLQNPASALEDIPYPRPYRNILPMPVLPPDSKHRGGPSTRQKGPKREWLNNAIHDSFDNCSSNATLTFEILPNKLPPGPGTNRPHRQDLESDNNNGSSTTTPHTSSVKSTAPTTTSVTILLTFNRRVAVVTDGHTNFLAKLFPPHSGSNSEKLLTQELTVYAACAILQGSYIPHLYAVGRVAVSDTFLLLTEYIESGINIAGFIEDLDVDEVSMAELADLRPGATAALNALHQLKVVHGNVAGHHMMLDDNERIVLVGFGRARVLSGDSARFRIAREKDETALGVVFDRPW